MLSDNLYDVPLDKIDYIYKLTSEGEADNLTWGGEVVHKVVAPKFRLGVRNQRFLHGCDHPILAVLLNSLHSNIYKPTQLWRCHCDPVGIALDHQVGCSMMSVEAEVPLPQISTINRIIFAFDCVSQVYTDDGFRRWAYNWVTGYERDGSVDRRIRDYIKNFFKGELRIAYATPGGCAQWAAHYLACGVTMYDQDNYSQNVLENVQYFVAASAVYARFAARRLGEDINFVKAVEQVLAA